MSKLDSDQIFLWGLVNALQSKNCNVILVYGSVEDLKLAVNNFDLLTDSKKIDVYLGLKDHQRVLVKNNSSIKFKLFSDVSKVEDIKADFLSIKDKK